MTRPRIKICCISSIDEARIAIEHGASALGLVGHMPGGPGVIGDERIYQIAKAVPPPDKHKNQRTNQKDEPPIG